MEKGGRTPTTFQNLILNELVMLQRYANFLCKRKKADVEDLVQQTILIALEHESSFTIGTNIQAWLSTIMRNHFYASLRKASNRLSHVLINAEWETAQFVTYSNNSFDHVYLKQVLSNISSMLPSKQQSALMYASLGYEMDEIADLERTKNGTIKSRIHRARKTLEEMDLAL